MDHINYITPDWVIKTNAGLNENLFCLNVSCHNLHSLPQILRIKKITIIMQLNENHTRINKKIGTVNFYQHITVHNPAN
jgi:hypothetical protein